MQMLAFELILNVEDERSLLQRTRRMSEQKKWNREFKIKKPFFGVIHDSEKRIAHDTHTQSEQN